MISNDQITFQQKSVCTDSIDLMQQTNVQNSQEEIMISHSQTPSPLPHYVQNSHANIHRSASTGAHSNYQAEQNVRKFMELR
jgi:hypothetical protein